MPHTCHAACCNVEIPRERLMCPRHWYMIPPELRGRIWRTYRKGQCDDWQITHEYAVTARAAVRAVAEKEGHSEEDIVKACRVYDMLDPGANNVS